MLSKYLFRIFGCILNDKEFEEVKTNLVENKINFIVAPQTRYKGKVGEQKTMFCFRF